MTHVNWPGMSGDKLAAFLESLASSLERGDAPSAPQLEALQEAIARAEESE